MLSDLASVVCPSCFVRFEIPVPGLDEVPCEVDYDCEICCHPMVVGFREEDGEIVAEARGLEE